MAQKASARCAGLHMEAILNHSVCCSFALCIQGAVGIMVRDGSRELYCTSTPFLSVDMKQLCCFMVTCSARLGVTSETQQGGSNSCHSCQGSAAKVVVDFCLRRRAWHVACFRICARRATVATLAAACSYSA